MTLSIGRLLSPYWMSDDEELAKTYRFLETSPNGYFIDVGANKGSYTQQLEDMGWNGILIEPLPDLAKQLRQKRKATVVECLVGSPEEAGSKQKFYRGRSTALSTLHPNAHLMFDITEVIDLPVRTLDSILLEHDVPEGFDFLKIDVEHHELAVVQGFDFAHWAPKLIIVEDHAYDRRLHKHITAQGYRYLQRVNLNNWYVPKASPDRTPLVMHYAFFRKFYVGLPVRIVKRLIKRAGNRRRSLSVG